MYGQRLSRLGGTCVNVGCVPKKLFCYASHFRELFHDAHSYGWPKVDFTLADHQWQAFLERKNAEIARLNQIYEKTQTDNKVHLMKGHAQLKDPHTVAVNDKEYTSKYILLAVGGEIRYRSDIKNPCLWNAGHPVVPNIPGREHIITSDQAFYLEKLPKKVMIVGK